MLTLSERATRGARLFLRMNEARRRFQTERTNHYAGSRWALVSMVALTHLEGRPLPIKALIAEVAPDWISEATALRLVHGLVKRGRLVIEIDPRDRRTKLVKPTPELFARMELVWEFIFSENVIPRELKEKTYL